MTDYGARGRETLRHTERTENLVSRKDAKKSNTFWTRIDADERGSRRMTAMITADTTTAAGGL
jgi:hypothetical protein